MATSRQAKATPTTISVRSVADAATTCFSRSEPTDASAAFSGSVAARLVLTASRASFNSWRPGAFNCTPEVSVSR